MKAPEKIYLTEDNPLKEWYRTKQVGFDSIEYICKDAFIEKAVGYLNSKLYDWVRIEHSNPSVSPELISKQDFVEDFKNYMKTLGKSSR